MRSAMEGDLIFAKLDDGEDIFSCIKELIGEHIISSAAILSNIGMLREFELNFFKDGKYQAEFHEEPMELVAMHGSIAGDGSIHIHCALAGEDHIVRGGHLSKAKVAVLNELVIRKLSDIRIGREHNPKTGLNETTVE